MHPNPIGALPHDEYPIYSPALIVEVLSPSNTAVKLNRQRISAMSAGTEEFWIVDPEERTVFVTILSGARTYVAGEAVQVKDLRRRNRRGRYLRGLKASLREIGCRSDWTAPALAALPVSDTVAV